MTQKISASFGTRRDADMAVEHLVQEHGIDPDAIGIAAASEGNSSGVAPSGGDLDRQDTQQPQLAGRLVVTAHVEDEKSAAARSAFESFGGKPWSI